MWYFQLLGHTKIGKKSKVSTSNVAKSTISNNKPREQSRWVPDCIVINNYMHRTWWHQLPNNTSSDSAYDRSCEHAYHLNSGTLLRPNFMKNSAKQASSFFAQFWQTQLKNNSYNSFETISWPRNLLIWREKKHTNNWCTCSINNWLEFEQRSIPFKL